MHETRTRRNQEIRQRMQENSIHEEIRTYKQNWIHHFDRIETGGLPKQTFNYGPRGTSDNGRPRKKWR